MANIDESQYSTQRHKAYKQAAIAYLVYGIIYMIGAIMELDDSRKVSHWGGLAPWWSFYVVGFAIMVTFPVYLWRRQVRWLALTLSFFTAGKAAWLCWLQGKHLAAGDPTNLYNWFFAAVALCASALLLRAGLQRAEEAVPTETGEPVA